MIRSMASMRTRRATIRQTDARRPADSTRSGSSTIVSNNFEADVRGAVAQLRSALLELLHTADVDAGVPQEMARRFKLNKNLTWKISRVAREVDLFASIPNVPGTEAWGIFLRAMSAADVPAKSLADLEAAISRFEYVQEVHAGDRSTLESMCAPFARSSEQHQQQLEADRRQAFRANSGIFGVRARAQLSCHFIAPSKKNPDRLDVAIAAGFLGFSRLRSNTPWAFATRFLLSDSGKPCAIDNADPLYPGSEFPATPPLILSLCTNPPPATRVVPMPDWRVRYEISEGPVGNRAALDCVAGWMHRAPVPRYRTDDEQYGIHTVPLMTPVEIVFHDFYVHRELETALNPQMMLFSQLAGGPMFEWPGDDRVQLPMTEEMIHLGSPPDPSAPEIPTMRMLVETAISRLGRRCDEFHGFRLRMKYPPIPTMGLFRFELPQRSKR